VGNQGSKNTTRQETRVLGPSDSLPEPDFTEQEVDEAVRNLNVNKCPGPDGIDGNTVKKLHKYLPRFWLDLFNMLRTGMLPNSMESSKGDNYTQSGQVQTPLSGRI
jgi:hypothetical protein